MHNNIVDNYIYIGEMVMKKVIITFFAIMLMVFVVSGCSASSNNNDVVRIHIRANSNDYADQEIKLKVRDRIVSYITPIIAGCDDAENVKIVLESELDNLEYIANNVLASNGYLYTSNARLDYEFFPSRKYEDIVFPADYYDALIIELGLGKGDNWWCVAYPPLCFVGEDISGDEVRYRSKLVELINKYFGD